MNYFYDLDEDPDDEDEVNGEEEQQEENQESSSSNRTEDVRKKLEERRQNAQQDNNSSGQSGNGSNGTNSTQQVNNPQPGGNSPQPGGGGQPPSGGGTPPTTGGTPPPASGVGASGTAASTTTASTTAATTTTASTTAAAGGTAAASGTAAAAGGTAAAAGGTAAAAGTASTIGTAVAAGGPYVWIAIAIIIAIIVLLIILTGIFMFLATMPGMVMDNLKGLFKTAGNYLAAFFGADTTQMIEDAQIYETLDYLDDMGWDIKGDGFLTDYYETEADLSRIDSNLKKEANITTGNYYIDDLMGVVRRSHNAGTDDADSIIAADSDFIFTYIMSDNYIYTTKNQNIATKRDNPEGFWGWLESIWDSINTTFYKIYNFVYGPIFDLFDIENGMIDKFGHGMLVFYEEDALGKRGDAINFGQWIDDVGININAEQGLLTIKRSGILNHNKPVEYNLDGWTGRYGMPLEFLLAVHKATLKPDLAYDMATSFNTNVNILLKDISGQIMSGYKSKNKIITWDQVTRVTDSFSNVAIIGPLLNWFDRLGTSEKEAIAMYDLGLDIITNINCPDCKTEDLPIVMPKDLNGDGDTLDEGEDPGAAGGQILKEYNGNYYYTQDDNEYDETLWGIFESDDADSLGDGEYLVGDTNHDGNISSEESSGLNMYGDEEGENADLVQLCTVVVEICSACKSKAATVSSLLQEHYDGKFKAYQPYIESVTDHWYRNVYFVKPSDIDFSDSQLERIKEMYGSVDDINFVIQDYDYEAVMRERWTLYKTYDNGDELAGNFIWYIVDEEGKFTTDQQAVMDSIEEDAEEEIDTSKLKQDDDGYFYYYVADIEDAKKVGLAVSKKAETIEEDELDDALEDLGWKKTGSLWSAYEVSEKQMQTGYEPLANMYNDRDEFKEDNPEELAENMYLNMITNGNIIQIGEGVRGETNPEIKKMFLQNKYFQYDGSGDTAEIITELREKLNEKRGGKKSTKYGPISDEELKLEFSMDMNEDGTPETYKIRDYAGTVTLEQDALNAFTMLENTHTLDADYIYRDFKELVVELGFYSKEELTEGVPRIMSFLIPEIGSAGFPERTIDKIENEFGTMIHSKYDIEANRKYTLKEVVNERMGDDPGIASVDLSNDNTLLASATRIDNTRNIVSRVNNDRLSLSANEINIEEVGAVKIAPKKPKQVPLETFLKKTREMCEYMNMVGYDYCVFSEPGKGDYRGACSCPPECYDLYEIYGICYKQTARVPSTKKANGIVCNCPANHCKHDVHRNDVKRPGHHLADTFELSKEAYANNVCCDRLVKWALQNVGVIAAGTEDIGGAKTLGEYIEGIDGAEVINHGEDLEPGDILVSSSHIEIVGEEKKTGFVQYNGGHQIDVGAVEGGDYSAIGLKTQAESWDWAEYAIRLPWAKSEEGVYEGYEGNEAVVSPVTGILLEYGTITRTNLDQKYKSLYQDEVNEEKNITELTTSNAETDPEKVEESEPINGRVVEEEVGYARILVLDREYYTALEDKVLAKDSSLKLYTDSNKEEPYKVQTQEELDQLLAKSNGFLNETILSYRDMMEDYEYAGIAGYVVTVEGFKPQLPDPDFDSNDDEHFDDEEKLPFEGKDTSNYDLTLDDFRVPLDKIKEPGDKVQTGYEIPEEHNVASEKANERNLVKELMKIDAAYAMEVTYKNKPAVFIKEGTIIGRTYTDREVILSLRGEQLTDYMSEATLKGEDPDDEEGNVDKIIGNYVRTIMENGTDNEKDKTYVEDVEDYMKLDELEKLEPNDWELFFWLPFESGPCDDEVNGGPECVGVCSPGETAIGCIQWTSIETSSTTNNIAGFCKAALEIDSSLCAPLKAFTGWTAKQFADDIGRVKGTYNADSQVKAALNQICETDRETFLKIQMDIAKEQYLEPLLAEYPWLEQRPSCVQGIVMHLRVWTGHNPSWLGAYEAASDEEIVLKCRNTIANTDSTAGPASGNENEGRAYNEPEIALQILRGKLTEEEIEEWVRTKDYTIVGFDEK